MGRASLKTVLCAVFCTGGVIYLSGCMKPVDLASFVENDEVREIIEKGAGTVDLVQGSDPGLVAGSKKITGLDTDKYYMVEEWDENGDSAGVQFVGANGGRSANLTGIGRVSGGAITGLDNSRHYRVRSAGPLPGNVPYQVLAPPGSSQTASNIDGLITLLAPGDSSTIVYALTPPLSSLSFNIVELSVSPAGSAAPARLSQGNIIALIGQDTVVDYVFFEDILFNFYVLRVAASDSPPPPPVPGLTITIVPYVHPTQPAFTFSPATANFTHAQAIGGLTINVTAAATPFDSVVGWYYGDTLVTGAAALTSADIGGETSIDFTVMGNYEFTFVGIIGAVPYNGTFTIVIAE